MDSIWNGSKLSSRQPLLRAIFSERLSYNKIGILANFGSNWQTCRAFSVTLLLSDFPRSTVTEESLDGQEMEEGEEDELLEDEEEPSCSVTVNVIVLGMSRWRANIRQTEM
jgi:hypothetical protein